MNHPGKVSACPVVGSKKCARSISNRSATLWPPSATRPAGILDTNRTPLLSQ